MESESEDEWNEKRGGEGMHGRQKLPPHRCCTGQDT
jgi:hypothetical protein